MFMKFQKWMKFAPPLAEQIRGLMKGSNQRCTKHTHTYTQQCKGDYSDDPDTDNMTPQGQTGKPALRGKYLQGLTVERV